jgi:hypothetical protein
MNGDDDPSPEAIEAEYERLRRIAVRAAMDHWSSKRSANGDKIRRWPA